MLLPRLFNDKFVDNVFDDMFSFPSFFSMPSNRWMSTNVKDMGNDYQLEIELPGYKKEDIHAKLDNGYLTIAADQQSNNEVKDEDGKYIRKESYSGKCQRSFYVGEDLKEEDFKASFKDGILSVVFPKEKNQNKIENQRYIPIE